MPIILAAVGDLHVNSTVGLCAPTVALDDGGSYSASQTQRWLWRRWNEYCDRVQAAKAAHDARVVLLLNGDLADRNSHGAYQLIALNRAALLRAAVNVLQPALDIADAVIVVRGTEAHVVNTCSIAGLLGSPYAGPYGISKFAALAATETLAADLGAGGASIGVTALCPGVVATDIARGSERHRPADLRTDRTEDQDFVGQVLDDLVEDGIDPAEVGALVVAAVRDGTFLLLTHPHHADGLRERAEALAAGRLPDRADFT